MKLFGKTTVNWKVGTVKERENGELQSKMCKVLLIRISLITISIER